MSDAPDIGTTDTAFDAGQSGPDVEQGNDTSSGGHPAWQPLRERLGDVSFKLIQPDLEDMDRKAQERFQAIHQEYEPIKGFKDLGVSVDEVKQFQQVVNLLNNDPVEFYRLLGQNPQIAASLSQSTDTEVEPDEEPDPSDLESNPAFQTLQQQNQQMMQMLQERQQAEQQKQVEADLDNELNTFWGQHPEFGKADQTMTVQLWAQQIQQDPNATLEQAAQAVTAYKQQILSAPRPGASAPSVMPTNGGTPSPNSQQALGKMTPKDTRALVAQMLDQQG